MRKVLTFLGASLLLTMVVSANAQQAPDMFKDVDTSHWAYQAVESLRSKGILIGYPDTYFRGKRTLTRYEFAVALDRALKTISGGEKGEKGDKGDTGEAGPAGEPGPQGEIGPPGVTPEELATFRRLVDEFRNELAGMGNNIAAINSKLDRLGKQVADLTARLDRMPKWYGGAFFGVRTDKSRGAYIDHDGRPQGFGPYALRDNPAIYHDFTLGVQANIPGGATLTGELTTNTYKNGLGGSLSTVEPLVVDPSSDTYVRRLEINAPFGGLGRDGKLTIGRFPHRISHLVLWRPEVDTYLDDPFESTGDYTMDGVRLATNFGSLSFDFFGAKTGSVQGTGNYNSYYPGDLTINQVSGNAWNLPFAGASSANVLGEGTKPFGIVDQGQIPLTQLAGVSVGLGFNSLMQGGHIRLTALDGDSRGSFSNFSNVLVLGADFDLGLTDRLKLNGEWGKSITNVGKFDTVNAHDNNAFNATLGYKSGGMDVTAGYRYIDPLFYAPGYWGRIGNWINPTNIQGPVVRAAYDFSPGFGVNVGGDFFSAARNRGPAGLTMNDDVNRILVGLRWDVAKNFQTTVDWEGVYWALDDSRFEGSGKIHPTEHYITLGTGYHLTSNTLIKLSYQIGTFDGHRSLDSGVGNRYNFNTISSQVAVKF